MFFTAALLFALPSIAAGQPLPRQIYARHCQKFEIMPEVDELDAWGDGTIDWNGTSTNWDHVRAQLNGLFKSLGPKGNKYVMVIGKPPQNILAQLAKEGFVPHPCPHPAIR
jgi:hypothetical protein